MKRKFNLVKEDIISFQDFKKLNENGARPVIGKTNYTYEAYPAKLKIVNELTNQVTTFNGKFCNKRVMFKLDHERRIITIEGIIKPPKDPIKRVFWDHGFTGARRVDSYSDINNSLRASFYIRDDNNDIRHFSNLSGVDDTKIVLSLEPDTKTWWASEDLTLEEAKSIMDKYEAVKV